MSKWNGRGGFAGLSFRERGILSSIEIDGSERDIVGFYGKLTLHFS